MRAPYYVIPNFMPNPDELRAGFDAHFADPFKHGPEHQVWNYWFVPESYTYLRTAPQKVIERGLIEQFVARLKLFALDNLGCEIVTWPNLSLYIEGCGQTVHNDSKNGAFGFVYSLTRWDQRGFRGGETQIFREQDYWASGRFRESGAGTSFYELVPSLYNQMLVFDDRMLHAVPTVHGTQDPREGRVVLHGHLSAKDAIVRGPLSASENAKQDIHALMVQLRPRIDAVRGRFHGFATFAIDVRFGGEVEQARLMVDRVLSTSGPGLAAELLEGLRATMAAIRFAACAGQSRINMPLFFE